LRNTSFEGERERAREGGRKEEREREREAGLEKTTEGDTNKGQTPCFDRTMANRDQA
jgi:hypothetical protein